MGADLPKILVSASPRKILSELPTLNIGALADRRELERAMKILSFIGHGYVWGEKNPVTAIPQSLAVPWHKLAQKLDRTPTLVYCSYALHNWRRIDPSGPLELGNICLLQNFLGGIDEEWFVLIHVDIEALAAPALAELTAMQEAAQSGNAEVLRKKLELMAACLERMNKTMERMPEHCDPYIYYNRVRPYIHGWKNNPSVPNGLIYKGVAEYKNQPQQFRGETGSQSSIIPCYSAALGIVQKKDQLSDYLLEMRDYMPREHRQFLERLERAPSTREKILADLKAAAGIKDSYNACVNGIDRFLSTHLIYAASYIEKQAPVDPKNPNKVGTGGTPFMQYLKKHQVGTSEHLI